MRHGHVAEWLRSGLQNRLPRFNSGRGLQQNQQFGERLKKRMVGKSVGLSVSNSAIRQRMKQPQPATVRSAKVGEHDLMPDSPDDAVERAGGRTHGQALTLGFCTFNLLECPIGSRA
jgi:hypothetical protein